MPDFHARLSHDDHEAIMKYAAAEGVPASAIIVALARWLREGGEPSEDVERCRQEIMRAAREIARENRDRKPPR